MNLSGIRRQLADLQRRWQASPAQRWLQLWLDELLGLLPPPWRARLAAAPVTQRLAWPLPDTFVRRLPARLVLPAHEFMAQTISLPVAATADLQRVLAFEIDRYTPYPAEQVQFAARVEGRRGATAQVLLVAVHRQRLQAILDHCHGAGLPVAGVDAQGVDLLPAELRPQAPAAWFNRVLALSVVVLLGALMLVVLNGRQASVARMQAEVQQQRQQVQALEQQRRELTDTQGAASYLARLKQARPTLTALLTELTQCLGDDTWLEQLEVRDGGEVNISGQSKHASALITRAHACHSLQDPRFQGVIQPDGTTGSERFSLVAQLPQEAIDAPSTHAQ